MPILMSPYGRCSRCTGIAVEELVVGLPNEEGLGVVGVAAVTLDGLELGRDRPLTVDEGGLDEC